MPEKAFDFGFGSVGSALVGGLALGIAKEVYDSQYPGRHKVEAADIAATFLGAALVYGGVRISVLRSKNATVFAYEIGL